MKLIVNNQFDYIDSVRQSARGSAPRQRPAYMKLVVDNKIEYVQDVLDPARDTLQRYERGELSAYAFRIVMRDGTHQDIVGGRTKEEQEEARANMLKRLALEHEYDVAL